MRFLFLANLICSHIFNWNLHIVTVQCLKNFSPSCGNRSQLYSWMTSPFFSRAFRKSLSASAAAARHAFSRSLSLSLSRIYVNVLFLFFYYYYCCCCCSNCCRRHSPANCLHVVPTCATFELAISTKTDVESGLVCGRCSLSLGSALFYVINNMFCSGSSCWYYAKIALAIQQREIPTDTHLHTHLYINAGTSNPHANKNTRAIVGGQKKVFCAVSC